MESPAKMMKETPVNNPITGVKLMDNIAANDYRQILPRVQGESFDHNKAIIERISEMAQRKGCTLAQLALAWVLHQGDDVGPIPGTTKIENLNQNLGALGVTLTAEDLAELDMNSFWIAMILWFTHIFRREYALMQVTIQVAAELLNVHPSYDMN